MPNHVSNILTVTGSEELVADFVKRARGVPPVPAPAFAGDEQEIPEEEVLCFHALVPLPDDYTSRRYDPYGYEQEHKLWGVKWGAYSLEEPIRDNGSVTYRFLTAWSPPIVFLDKVAALFPSLDFLLEYSGEIDHPGEILWTDGQLRQRVELGLLRRRK